jgi:hypothetical protein
VRYRAAFLGLAVLAAGCGGGKAGNQATAVAPQPPPTAKVTVAIKGATARPKANANWSYSVTARDSTGKKVSGKLTVQIVDPLGNAHAVTYDNTKKPVRNFPFHGTFHDFLQFPKDSIGFPLTVRAKVTSAQGKGTASFGVKPRS